MAKTVELAGAASFPRPYVEKISQQNDSLGAVIVKYALDKQLTKTPFSIYLPKRIKYDGGMPSDAGLYITSPTISDPHLAPEGRHILIACMAIPADTLDTELNQIWN